MSRKATKHKPPSRIRYEQSHPVISCRLPKADYDLLKQRLEELNISFATFVKSALDRLEIKMSKPKKAREEGYIQGYNKAKEEHQIWYFCNVCQERINISPDSESHKAIIQYMEEHGWGHKSCHEEQKKSQPLYKDNVILPPYFPHPYPPPHYPPR